MAALESDAAVGRSVTEVMANWASGADPSSVAAVAGPADYETRPTTVKMTFKENFNDPCRLLRAELFLMRWIHTVLFKGDGEVLFKFAAQSMKMLDLVSFSLQRLPSPGLSQFGDLRPSHRVAIFDVENVRPPSFVPTASSLVLRACALTLSAERA